jgi:hypothetical protein
LQIPLVAVGTAEAMNALQSDDQLANRFEPVGLPPWRNGEEYLQLLSTLEAVSGTETITAKLIDETGFISPSQRRRVAI